MAKKKQKPQKRRGTSPKMKKELDRTKASLKRSNKKRRDLENPGMATEMGWLVLANMLTGAGAISAALVQAIGDYYAGDWETAIDALLLVAGMGTGAAGVGLGVATGMPRLAMCGTAVGTGVSAVASANLVRELAGRGLDWAMTPTDEDEDEDIEPAAGPTLVADA